MKEDFYVYDELNFEVDFENFKEDVILEIIFSYEFFVEEWFLVDWLLF